MKITFTNHFKALALALLTSVGLASAQSVTVTATYAETYNQYNYTGQYKVPSTGAIHAIGGGTLTCKFSDLTMDAGYKLDSIKVSLPNVSGETKYTSLPSELKFNIETPSGNERLEYNVIAEVFTSNGNLKKNGVPVRSNTVYVYPEPRVPSVNKAGDNDERYDRGEGVKINRSVNVGSGGNYSTSNPSTTWSYKWNVTYTDNSAGAKLTNYTGSELNINANEVFALDQPIVREYTIECEFSNMSPDGISTWISGKLTGFKGLKIYNCPSHHPDQIGHFVDAESGQDFYLAMNLGVNDATLDASSYNLIFVDADGVTHEGKGRRLDNPGTAITNIYAQWKYGDGYVAPKEKTIAKLKKPTVMNLSYNATYRVSLNVGSLAGDDKYRQTPVTVGNVLHCYAGAQATATHSVSAVGMTLTSSTVTSQLASDKIGSNRQLNGTNTWNGLTAGEYVPELKVEGEFNIDTNQRYKLTCTRNADYNIKIWDAPYVQKGFLTTYKFSDIESPKFNITVSAPTGGNTQGWDYYWEREHKSTHQKVKLGSFTQLTSDDPITDPSDVMNKEEYTYRFVYTNYTPDGKDVWFTHAIDMADVTVYNAPTAPKSLLYMPDGNGYIIAATNLGLSDEMISAREYSFKYNTGEIVEGKRFYDGKSQPTQVRSRWKYDDREVLSAPADRSDADPKAKLTIRPEINGIKHYKGHVEDDNCIYALSGSKLTFNVDIDQNFIVKASKISTGADDEGAGTEVNGNNSSRVFIPSVDEPKEYSVVANIEVQPIFDSYKENGETKYITASDNVALPQLDFPKTIKIYPQPSYPEVTVEVFDWDDDNMATPMPLAIDKVTGGVENSWSYTWLMNGGKVGSNDVNYTIENLDKIEGPNKEYKNYQLIVRVKNMSPLKKSDWIEGDIKVADINVYNVPNAPKDFVKYVNETNQYYVVRGLGITDDQIRAQQYKFDFGGEEIAERSYQSNTDPSSVRALFRYEGKDLHKEGHISYSKPAYLAEEVATPNFNSTVTINGCNWDGKYGYAYRYDKKYGYYALSSTNANIKLEQKADRFTLRNGRLNINNQQLTGSTLSYNIAFTYTNSGASNYLNTYNPVFSGDIAYQAEVSLSGQGYTILPFRYTTGDSVAIHIYPDPLIPEKKAFDVTQFRDIDQIAPVYNDGQLTLGGGNNDNWQFSWFYDSEPFESENICHPVIGAQAIDGDNKAYEDHEFELFLYNMSPLPGEESKAWLQNSYKVPVRIYNTPVKPTTLVKKGNGTSGIYIINGMPYDDNTLTSLQYRFEFGDGGSAVSTEEIGRRWYKYTSPQDPWVRSLWEYADGFNCYSDVTYADGSRGELSISDIMMDESLVQMVYTASGTAIGKVALSDLQPGLYIVEYGEGDQRTIQKVYVK